MVFDAFKMVIELDDIVGNRSWCARHCTMIHAERQWDRDSCFGHSAWSMKKARCAGRQWQAGSQSARHESAHSMAEHVQEPRRHKLLPIGLAQIQPSGTLSLHPERGPLNIDSAAIILRRAST